MRRKFPNPFAFLAALILLAISIFLDSEWRFVSLILAVLAMFVFGLSWFNASRGSQPCILRSISLGAIIGLGTGVAVSFFSLGCLFGYFPSYPGIRLACYIFSVPETEVYGMCAPRMGLMVVGNLLAYGIGGFVIGSTHGALFASRRAERKRLGLCVECGYDLRGSDNRCPECGQEFGAVQESTASSLQDRSETGQPPV